MRQPEVVWLQACASLLWHRHVGPRCGLAWALDKASILREGGLVKTRIRPTPKNHTGTGGSDDLLQPLCQRSAIVQIAQCIHIKKKQSAQTCLCSMAQAPPGHRFSEDSDCAIEPSSNVFFILWSLMFVPGISKESSSKGLEPNEEDVATPSGPYAFPLMLLARCAAPSVATNVSLKTKPLSIGNEHFTGVNVFGS